MNWLDVGTIILLAVSSLYGLATGLILSLVKIASYFIAFIVAKVYYIPFSTFIINNTGIYTAISGFIDGRMQNLISSGHDIIDNVTYDSVQSLNLPKVLENSVTTSVSNITQGMDTLTLTTVISSLIVNIISIIIIFVTVRVIIMLLGKILDKFASVPIINEFNKLGGFVFGFLKGGLIVFMITALMLPLASLAPNNLIIETLHASKITRLFYEYNLILYIFNEMLFNVGF